MFKSVILGLNFILLCSNALAGEWSGYLAGEARVFFDNPLDQRQHDETISLSFQPEYFHEWDDGYQSIVFVPFFRLDGSDDERSHLDIRELAWIKAAQNWELRLGIRKVYWGVTESQHLVDIINQTDQVENVDGEDKLGQPMLNFAFIRNWGTVDLFVMPWFRERTFPGLKGRLRSALPVDTQQAAYESGAKQQHLDWALRWSHSIGMWDIGLSHFEGTGRDPRFSLGLNGQGQPVLIPFYEQISQTGLDLQVTLDDWLWKLELISRDTSTGRFSAFTGGFEYTFVGVMETSIDIGLVAEYSFDDRDDAVVMDDDLFVGMRLTLNDAQSSEFLAGVINDLNGGGRLFSVEASRRLGDSWKLSVEARVFSGLPSNDPLAGLRQDDFLQIELARYF